MGASANGAPVARELGRRSAQLRRAATAEARQGPHRPPAQSGARPRASSMRRPGFSHQPGRVSCRDPGRPRGAPGPPPPAAARSAERGWAPAPLAGRGRRRPVRERSAQGQAEENGGRRAAQAVTIGADSPARHRDAGAARASPGPSGFFGFLWSSSSRTWTPSRCRPGAQVDLARRQIARLETRLLLQQPLEERDGARRRRPGPRERGRGCWWPRRTPGELSTACLKWASAGRDPRSGRRRCRGC